MDIQRLAGTVVLMERFDAEQALALIERYSVTCGQFVPTMFVRMLKLPEGTRGTLRPVEPAIRRARGGAVPGRREAADDGVVGPDHLRVLLVDRGRGRHVRRARGVAGAPGHRRQADGRSGRCTSSTTTATSCRSASRARSGSRGALGFEYRNDPTKTAEAVNALGYKTVGDIGYLDDEGYLYLTDRKAHMIISGGVNIYPQETENVLVDAPEGDRRRGVRRARRRPRRAGEGGGAAGRLVRRRPRARSRS